jgi:hypothetical protein
LLKDFILVGYLIGTTNQLLLQFPKSNPDCVLNLDASTFDLINVSLEPFVRPSKEEINFIKNLNKVSYRVNLLF